jgi:hypothetical protein
VNDESSAAGRRANHQAAVEDLVERSIKLAARDAVLVRFAGGKRENRVIHFLHPLNEPPTDLMRPFIAEPAHAETAPL